MRQLRINLASVEIDHNSLHLLDVGGARLPGLGYRAGHYIDCGALARCPGGEGGQLRGGLQSASIQILCGLPSKP